MSLTPGFRRYAFSVMYHGGHFMGWQWQRGREKDGMKSVEGCIREALEKCWDIKLQDEGTTRQIRDFKNLQGSSRTDRGVHAMHNTFHVDIEDRPTESVLDPNELLMRLQAAILNQQCLASGQRLSDREAKISLPNRHLRILNAKFAPRYMDNPWAREKGNDQPHLVDWNARFSVTDRTYVYRILCCPEALEAVPWEHDRSWRVSNTLDISAMKAAGNILEGWHDMSSFRNAHCQRHSPYVQVKKIWIQSQPYDFPSRQTLPSLSLVIIGIQGNSFVFRQVRNMVGCLVSVGEGRISPMQVHDILEAKDRRVAPIPAPSQGLFLARVRHRNFEV